MSFHSVLGGLLAALLFSPSMAVAAAPQCQVAFGSSVLSKGASHSIAPSISVDTLLAESDSRNVDTDLAAALAEEFRPTLDQAALVLDRPNTAADDLVTTKRLERHAARLTQFSDALENFQKLKDQNPGLLSRFMMFLKGPKGAQIHRATSDIAEGAEAAALIFKEIDRELLVSNGLIKTHSRLEKQLLEKVRKIEATKLLYRRSTSLITSPTRQSAIDTLQLNLFEQAATLQQMIEVSAQLRQNIKRNAELSSSLHQKANDLLTLALPLLAFTTHTPELMKKVENAKAIGETFEKKTEIPRLQQMVLEMQDQDLRSLALEQLLTSTGDSSRAQVHRWAIRTLLDTPSSHPALLKVFSNYAATATFSQDELDRIKNAATNSHLPEKNRTAAQAVIKRSPALPALAESPQLPVLLKQFDSLLPKQKSAVVARLKNLMKRSEPSIAFINDQKLKMQFFSDEQGQRMKQVFAATQDGTLQFRVLLDSRLRTETNVQERTIMITARLLLDEKFGADEKSAGYLKEIQESIVDILHRYDVPKKPDLDFIHTVVRHRLATTELTFLTSLNSLIRTNYFGRTSAEIREALLKVPEEIRKKTIRNFLESDSFDRESMEDQVDWLGTDAFFVVPLAFGAIAENRECKRIALRVNRLYNATEGGNQSVWPRFLNELLGIKTGSILGSAPEGLY